MQFGILHNTSISAWRIVPLVEQLGYDSAWFGDSQMIWSDCYATMALAAEHTSRIRLASGVAIAGTRIAPVVASAIGSINQIAPGRVRLGIGTGYTAMRTMGFDPMKAGEFRDYVRVLRDLLDGRPTQFTLGGETREIAHLHPGEGFWDFEHRIPLYVAADGPLACATAGAYADGRINGGESLDQFARKRALVADGAAAVGRVLPDPFPHVFLVTALALRPGETLTSDRVIDTIGAEAATTLHGWWEGWTQTGADAFVPDDCRDTWEQYKAYLNGLNLPPEALRRRVHRGHCTYLAPEERAFVTPQIIRQTGKLIGPPDEIIHNLREWERAGLTELVLLCATDAAREMYADFAREVIAKY